MWLRDFPLAAGTLTFLISVAAFGPPAGAHVSAGSSVIGAVLPIGVLAQVPVGATPTTNPASGAGTPVPVAVGGASAGGSPNPVATPVTVAVSGDRPVIVSTVTTTAPSGSVSAPSGPAPATTASSGTVGPRVLDVTGAGWGHGRGLGQWGAYGYAIDQGWEYRRILGHFYANTTVGQAAGDGLISVRLTDLDAKPVTFYGERRPGVFGPNGPVVVTSAPTATSSPSSAVSTPTTPGTAPPVLTPTAGEPGGGVAVRGTAAPALDGFSVRQDAPSFTEEASVGAPAPEPTPAPVAAPTDGPGAVRVQLVGPGTWQISDASSCSGPFTVRATVSAPTITVRAPRIGSPEIAGHHAQVCERNGRRAYRGDYEVIDAGRDGQRTLNIVELDAYLRGVVPREIPSIWGSQPNGMAALKAQTVAARSYAAAERRNAAYKTCDTIACQVYRGMGVVNSRGVWEPSERPLTDQAVRETAGEVRLTSAGKPARTEFSASTGGHTAPGDFPPVPDTGDATAPNPNRRWTVRLTASQLEAGRDLGPFVAGEVVKRDGNGPFGGRAQQVRLQFARGSVTLGGQEFASKFRLRSSLYTFDPSASAAGVGGGSAGSPSGPVPVDPAGPGGVPAIGTPDDGQDPVDVLLGVAARPQPAPTLAPTTIAPTTTKPKKR